MKKQMIISIDKTILENFDKKIFPIKRSNAIELLIEKYFSNYRMIREATKRYAKESKEKNLVSKTTTIFLDDEMILKFNRYNKRLKLKRRDLLEYMMKYLPINLKG